MNVKKKGSIMTNPLVGVWELVSDTHEGLFIVAETHAVHLLTEKNRELFSNENEPTEAEELAAFRSMLAGAGTYSVSGNVFAFTNSVSRTPNHGDDKKTFSFEFTIEGDTVTYKDTSDGHTFVFRKIG